MLGPGAVAAGSRLCSGTVAVFSSWAQAVSFTAYLNDDDAAADDDDSFWAHVLYRGGGGAAAAAAAVAAAAAGGSTTRDPLATLLSFRCDRWPQLTTEHGYQHPV